MSKVQMTVNREEFVKHLRLIQKLHDKDYKAYKAWQDMAFARTLVMKTHPGMGISMTVYTGRWGVQFWMQGQFDNDALGSISFNPGNLLDCLDYSKHMGDNLTFSVGMGKNDLLIQGSTGSYFRSKTTEVKPYEFQRESDNWEFDYFDNADNPNVKVRMSDMIQALKCTKPFVKNNVAGFDGIYFEKSPERGYLSCVATDAVTLSVMDIDYVPSSAKDMFEIGRGVQVLPFVLDAICSLKNKDDADEILFGHDADNVYLNYGSAFLWARRPTTSSGYTYGFPQYQSLLDACLNDKSMEMDLKETKAHYLSQQEKGEAHLVVHTNDKIYGVSYDLLLKAMRYLKGPKIDFRIHNGPPHACSMIDTKRRHYIVIAAKKGVKIT